MILWVMFCMRWRSLCTRVRKLKRAGSSCMHLAGNDNRVGLVGKMAAPEKATKFSHQNHSFQQPHVVNTTGYPWSGKPVIMRWAHLGGAQRRFAFNNKKVSRVQLPREAHHWDCHICRPSLWHNCPAKKPMNPYHWINASVVSEHWGMSIISKHWRTSTKADQAKSKEDTVEQDKQIPDGIRRWFPPAQGAQWLCQ